MYTFRYLPYVFGLCLFWMGEALADKKVDWSATVEPSQARIGEAVTVHLDAIIPEGYVLYSMVRVEDGPLPLEIKHPEFLDSLSSWIGPKPKTKFDDIFQVDTPYFDGSVRHSRTFRVTEGATAPAFLDIDGQICNPRQCLRIKTQVELPLSFESGQARRQYSEAAQLEGTTFSESEESVAQAPEAVEQADEDPTSSGLWGYLIFAFLAGLGALLTPCVFPMIPITVSFFTKFSEVSMKRSALMASVYTGSIIVSFTLVGVLVSVIFGAVGMQTISTSTFFNLFLFALLVFFAFNLFGLFEISVPSGLINKVSAQERALTSEDEAPIFRQLLGVSLMALTFTLVSFTCTVGFVGLVLAEAAKGNWFFPTVGMFAFSTAFALPFFLLAMFPAYATKLQGKAGDWMVAVKAMLGFLELAAAFKFLSNVDLAHQWGIITRPLVLALWAGIFLTAALYLLKVFLLPHNSDGPARVNPLRMLLAMIFFGLAIHCASGMRDTRSMGGWLDAWLPPAIYPGQHLAAGDGGSDGHLSFINNDMDRGFSEAKREDKPLFIDFTGYSCANCRLMEMSVFPLPEVKSRLEKMVRVAAYTDGKGELEEVCETQRRYQVERFETAALPFYVILDPHKDTVLATFADMAQDPADYVAFLDKGLAAFEKAKQGRQKSQKYAPAVPVKTATTPSSVKGASAPSQVPASATMVEVDPKSPLAMSFQNVMTGQSHPLAKHAGEWLLVNFWATWCGPCKVELRDEFPKAFAGRTDVRLVTLAFDQMSSFDRVKTFVETLPMKRAVHLIADGFPDSTPLPDAYGTQDGNLPVSYLINPKGEIVWTKQEEVHGDELKAVFRKHIGAP